MKDTKPSPPGAAPSGSGTGGRPSIALVLAGALFVVAAGWAAFDYWESRQKNSEILVYHLCVGTEQKLCPSEATFVRNQGDDTLTKWAQNQCTGYRARRIIVNEGPKDCGCSLADITCSSE
jgi:hypothetical protein